MTDSYWRSRVFPILLGVAYGVALRILLASNHDIFAGLVSISFFVVVPAAIGFLVVFVRGVSQPENGGEAFFEDAAGAWADFRVIGIAIVAFLITTMLLLLEGIICVLMALPGFVLFASIGGLIAGWLKRRRTLRSSTLSIVLLIPVVMSPIEAQFPAADTFETRSDTILVDASPADVWWQIVNVEEIQKSELRFGLTRALGVPRPVRAHMDMDDSASVRYTEWDKGVSFQENIVAWKELEQMTWEFEFPAGSIPEGVLDDHVIIGGAYFDLIGGGYRLSELPDGKTALTLTTNYRISARPRLYSEFWAELVMGDFQKMILDLVRDRAEAQSS